MCYANTRNPQHIGEKKRSTVEQVSAQPMPKAEVMEPVLPDQAVSRNSRRILSITTMLLRMRYSTFVAHIILFFKSDKKGFASVSRLCGHQSVMKSKNQLPGFPFRKKGILQS
jgi:hypothetical protein